MNCKNCNAVMRADTDKKMFICPYCESTEPFTGFSNQQLKEELKGIVSEAIRDANQAGKGVNPQEDGYRDPRSGAQKAKDGFVKVMQIIFCVFLGIFSVTIFTDDFRLVGFISLAQMILLIVAIASKSKFHRTGDKKAQKRAKICVIAASILIFVWFTALMMENNGGGSVSVGSKTAKWPATGLGSELPVMPGNLDYVYSNKNSFNADSKGTTATDFVTYMNACKEAGYNIDTEETADSFIGYDKDDNKLELKYRDYSNKLEVNVEKAIVMSDFEWYTQGLAGEIPNPEAEKMCLKTLKNDNYPRFEIYVGDLTQEEFGAYMNKCVAEGFEKTENSDGSFNFKKEISSGKSTGGKKLYVRMRIELQRGRIMYIEAYESDY